MSGPPPPKLHAIASIGRGTAAMVIGSTAFLLFSLVGRVAVARLVSTDAWGLFNLGLSLVGLLSLVALLGLHQATARTLSYEKDPYVRRHIVTTALLITSLDAVLFSLGTFLLAGPLASLFSPSSGPALVPIFQALAVTIGFTLMSNYLAALFQGFEETAPNAWFNQTLNPGLFVAFVVSFLLFHPSIAWAVLAYVLASGVAFGALALYTIVRLPGLLPRLPARAAPSAPLRVPSEFWQLSVSLWGVNALAFVTTFIDTLILGAYRNASVVGLYSDATTFARLFLVGNAALTYIYLPVTARLYRDGDLATIRTTYVTSTRWVVAIAFPLFLLFVFLPRQSLVEIFDPSGAGAALSLQILAVGAFISIVLGPVNSCQAGLGQNRILNVTSLVAAVVNISLSFALIPTYGLIGASIAWTAARVTYPGLGAVLLWWTHRVTAFRRELTVPLAVALAVGGGGFFVLRLVAPPAWTIFPLFFVGFAVFVGAILATRSLSKGDLLAVRGAERLLGRPLTGLRSYLERFVLR